MARADDQMLSVAVRYSLLEGRRLVLLPFLFSGILFTFITQYSFKRDNLSHFLYKSPLIKF